MTYHHPDDPAVRWSAQLQGLYGRRRETVIKALRTSVASGFPANEDGVRILVAYTQGQIGARQYVAQMLESLGFWPAAYTPPPAPEPEPWRSAVSDSWADKRPAPPALLDFRESRRESVSGPNREWRSNTLIETRRSSRQQAVQAFVKGQIPMEEFLRISGT